ncbi:MAG TPA: glutathione ABC transporter substrate-binding protein GsiB [Acetobacteraceae bacterium]|nr:glutathione ABC transporter substrate-binding protein GsiB [Acetobacteraceae bacterium]
MQIPRRIFIGSSLALAAATAARPSHAAGNSDLTVGVPTNLTGLDPADVNDTLSQSACRLMMQGLYGFDKDMNLIPVLAESYTASEDAKEFTFKLRTGISFHDGAPFDAAAVKANFDRVTDPANHLKRTSLYEMIDHTDVVDPTTVRFVLKNPFGAFVPTIAHPAGMQISPKAIQQYGKEISRNPVGTGPFKFVSWSADTLKVTKNDKYWKPNLPQLASVTFRSVPENGARLAMLQAGEAQFIYPMPPEMIKAVEHNANITVNNAPSIYERYVAMNVMKHPYDDLRVRQALNYAVDKAAFAKVVWNGYEDPADSPIPPHLAFHVAQQPWPYDPAKAKQLLKDAGVGDGFDTEIWANTVTISLRAMQFLQQQLAAVGIRVKVTPLEAGLLGSKIFAVQRPADSDLELYTGAWSSSTGDADWGLRPLFGSQAFPPKLFNVGYYSNKSLDEKLAAALATADSNKRAALYADAQKLIWNDAPWIFLGVDRNLSAQSKKLNGLYMIPDGGLLIEEAALTA